jgi:hypothetical protein
MTKYEAVGNASSGSERRRAMLMRTPRFAMAGAAVMLAAVTMLSTPAIGQNQVASDRSAGYVVWPKLFVDINDIFNQGRTADTVIQITNTANAVVDLQCYFVDATPRCTNGLNRFDTSTACRLGQVPSDCLPGGTCEPTWNETDFPITLSPFQPFGWRVSEGGDVPPAQGSSGGSINPVGDTYFIGELKCIQVDTADLPVQANDIKGEATIYEVAAGTPGFVDVRSYNAIGIPAVGPPNGDRVLCLGATTGSAECATAEYAGCPAVLVLNHFFDSAFNGEFVTTDLTLVPCSEDLAEQTITTTSVQFLVFNEFEQRFSASTQFQCFQETQLSRIDRRPGQESTSIWNLAVQGTITGQTRIRPVLGSETDVGHGILGVAEQFRTVVAAGNNGLLERGSAAFNLNYIGVNPGRGDFVRFEVP